MRRRTDVEAFRRVAAKVSEGVGPADDGLHFEHAFDDAGVARRWREL